jgi:hypothetical protein
LGVAIRKNAVEVLDVMTFRPLKNAKIQTKTYKMDVWEALEDEPLESHSRGPGFESL